MSAPGNTPFVCILSDGDRPCLQGAIASARRFGLSVLIGASAKLPDGAESVGIEWRGDFATARNQLADFARKQYGDHRYLLWLDSDEELISWLARDWG